MERENIMQLKAEITCPPRFPYYYIRNLKASTGKSSGSKLGLGNLQCFPRCPHGNNSLHYAGTTCGSHVEVRLSCSSFQKEGSNKMKIESIRAYARFRTREMKTHEYKKSSKYVSSPFASKVQDNVDIGYARKKRKTMSKDEETFHIAASELENKLLCKIGNECSTDYLDRFINTNKTDGRLGELYEGVPIIVNGNEIIFKFFPQQRSTWQLSKYKGSRYLAALHTLHIVFFEVIESQNSSSSYEAIKEQSHSSTRMKFVHEIESEEFLILGHRKKVLWKTTSKEIKAEDMIINLELRRNILVAHRESKIFPESLIYQSCSCKITEGKESRSDADVSLNVNDSSEIHPMQVLGTPNIDLCPQKLVALDNERAIFEARAQNRSSIDEVHVLDDDDRLFLLQQISNSSGAGNSDDLFNMWKDLPISKDM